MHSDKKHDHGLTLSCNVKDRLLEKSKANAQGANNMSEKWAGIRTVTGGQLTCQIYYE